MSTFKKSVPISAFRQGTRFAVSRIMVAGSSFKGCIEVHLSNYDTSAHSTPAGGCGLLLEGRIDHLSEFSFIFDKLALLSGFDEVFEVAAYWEDVVVLQPLGVGLGVNWELFKQYSGKSSRKARLRKKYQTRAAKVLAAARHRIAQLTGKGLASTGTYFLRETTLTGAHDAKRFTTETTLTALTLGEARKLARARVVELAAQGWKCGEEGPCGTVQRASSFATDWFCLDHHNTKWVSIEYGTPTWTRTAVV